MQFLRKLYYLITGKETKWDYLWDGSKYHWNKLRLPVKRGDMMRKLFTVAMIVLLPSLCLAAPFVVCDPYLGTGVQPDNFKVVLDGTASNSSPQTVPEGVRLHMDIGSVSVGSHSMTVSACKTYPADEWNPNPVEACSAAAVFAFTRPAEGTSPSAPASIRLSNE